MLRREHRLTDGPSFGRAIRHGRRAGSRSVVVHLATRGELSADQVEAARPPRVGLVVGKAVGNAVVRNLVKRRLRHLMRERVTSLPLDALVVVRALPASATSSYDQLGEDLDHALVRAMRGRRRPGATEGGAR